MSLLLKKRWKSTDRRNNLSPTLCSLLTLVCSERNYALCKAEKILLKSILLILRSTCRKWCHFSGSNHIWKRALKSWKYKLKVKLYTLFFIYKHKVHKHTQPQVGRILSTLLSMAPASDLVVDIKIDQNLQFFLNFFSRISKNTT